MRGRAFIGSRIQKPAKAWQRRNDSSNTEKFSRHKSHLALPEDLLVFSGRPKTVSRFFDGTVSGP
jgi:hypothetical protein